MGVVIVHHMEISMPTSWHSLDQAFSKVIERNGDLHVLVVGIRIAMPQKHHLIMVRHVIVRNRYRSGPINCINQPIFAVGQRAMVL